MDFISLETGYQPEVHQNGIDYLFFGGTSYLGLNYHTDYLKMFTEGIQNWGLNNGASRNNNIRLNIYEQAEEQLAKDYNCEAAATLSSGWLAAQTAVEVLGEKSELIYINDAHPALFKNAPSVLTLEKGIDFINASSKSNFLLISNSVNNIIPEVFNFSALSRILSSKKVILLLDHSHGFGYLDSDWLEQFKTLPKNIDLVLCGSLAKGLSLDAGVILGPKHCVNEIKNSAVFNGSSPCSPAVLYTYINSETIRLEAKAQLFENLDYIIPQLNQNDFFWTKNLPVILIKNQEISEKLKAKNFLFTSFPYPNPDSEILNRLVISAAHQPEHLKKLALSIL